MEHFQSNAIHGQVNYLPTWWLDCNQCKDWWDACSSRYGCLPEFTRTITHLRGALFAIHITDWASLAQHRVCDRLSLLFIANSSEWVCKPIKQAPGTGRHIRVVGRYNSFRYESNNTSSSNLYNKLVVIIALRLIHTFIYHHGARRLYLVICHWLRLVIWSLWVIVTSHGSIGRDSHNYHLASLAVSFKPWSLVIAWMAALTS